MFTPYCPLYVHPHDSSPHLLVLVLQFFLLQGPEQLVKLLTADHETIYISWPLSFPHKVNDQVHY